MALLRILAFFAPGVPEDFFIFVALAFFLVAHDTGKSEFRHAGSGAGLVCLRTRGAPILGCGVNAAIEDGELELAPTENQARWR